LNEISESPDPIETISKKLSKYTADIDGAAQEAAGARVAAATGLLGGAFGNAEFKKIITYGLKND